MRLFKMHRKGMIPRRPIEQTDGGFTILEIMLAIGILSIGLLAIASMQISAVRGNSSARDISEAATLAELQMETLMSLPYRFELALDNQNHAELQETSAVFDPSDAAGLGLNNPFPVDTRLFNPSAYDMANPAANTYPPDHFRTEDKYRIPYTIMWNVTTDAEINNTKSVRVLVVWVDDGGVGRIVSMQRVIPRIG
jgi:prepilin-type N-terminal cleavage/methylation domain-containing protein